MSIEYIKLLKILICLTTRVSFSELKELFWSNCRLTLTLIAALLLNSYYNKVLIMEP